MPRNEISRDYTLETLGSFRRWNTAQAALITSIATELTGTEVDYCSTCEIYIPEEYTQANPTRHELRICDNCLDAEYFQCENCDEYYPSDSDSCDHCGYGEYPPIGNPHRTMFGLEIELEFTCAAARDRARVLARQLTSTKIVDDSSLGYGFELVVDPFSHATLTEGHENLAAIEKYLATTLPDRVPGNAGGHIHVSRTAFNDAEHVTHFVDTITDMITRGLLTDARDPYHPLRRRQP